MHTAYHEPTLTESNWQVPNIILRLKLRMLIIKEGNMCSKLFSVCLTSMHKSGKMTLKMSIACLYLLILSLSVAHAKTLTIGIPPFSPPFVMKADNQNHFIGFSMDIMEMICKRLQVTCKYQPIIFDQAFSKLIDNSIDIAIGSFTITPEREEEVLFSLPYLQSHAAFITLETNSIKSIDELKSKTIGVEKDSIFVNYLEQKFGNSVKIKTYQTIPDIMFAMSDNDIDAAIFDKETVDFWLGNNYDMFKLVGNPIPLGLGIGIMTNKMNNALIAQINQSLLNMEADGSYLKIYNNYFGSTSHIPTP